MNRSVADSSVCESSICNYFDLNGFQCDELQTTSCAQTWLKTQVPKLDNEDIEKEDVFEWLGDVACEAAL